MALIYWVLLIVWAALGLYSTRTNRDYFALGNTAIIWVLFVLIGFKVFGFNF